MKPSYYRGDTILLDYFLDEYPKWHSGKTGPEKFRNYIYYPEVELDWSMLSYPKFSLIDNDIQYWFENFSVQVWKLYWRHISISGWGMDDQFVFNLNDIDGSNFEINVYWDKKVVIKFEGKNYKTTLKKLNSYLK